MKKFMGNFEGEDIYLDEEEDRAAIALLQHLAAESCHKTERGLMDDGKLVDGQLRPISDWTPIDDRISIDDIVTMSNGVKVICTGKSGVSVDEGLGPACGGIGGDDNATFGVED